MTSAEPPEAPASLPAPAAQRGRDLRGPATRAVHPPALPAFGQQPIATPVYRSAAFVHTDAQEYADILGGRRPGYTYSRADNPTSDAFAAAAAAQEGAGVSTEVAGQPFASGMGAISSVLFALLRAGGHVVAPAELYGGTFAVLTGTLDRFGVSTSFVDSRDLEAVAAAVRPETALVWAETISNPTTTVADLPGLAEVAHAAGVPLVVDSTFAPPPVCRPLEHGADLVVHSATKYLGGHADVTGGVVLGGPPLLARVRSARVELGPSLSPDDAFLLSRGLLTLPLRMERHCASALAFAQALSDHPAVERVDYPGLPGHPQHGLAQKLFDPGRFGAIVTVIPRGGRAAGMALCDRLRLVLVASSLGGVHSKVSHAASTTHRMLSDEALLAGRISPAAVRFSVGLEDIDDLVDDAVAALDTLA